MCPAGITKVSPWEVVLLSPTLFGRRSQGLSQQPSIAGSSQATALEGAQQPQGYLHHVSGQLQGMAHGTALHQMAAPGVIPQGVMGQPGSGAGPSQGSARGVAGAHSQDWQVESGDFTTNARSVSSARLCLCTRLMVWSCTNSRCMSTCMCMYVYMYAFHPPIQFCILLLDVLYIQSVSKWCIARHFC